MFLSISPVFDYIILDEIYKYFARHIIVEAEQMPLSKTQQNTNRAFILASKLNSFQKQQLRNGKCFFEKSSKVMVWGLNYNKKNIFKRYLSLRDVFSGHFLRRRGRAVGAKMHFFITLAGNYMAPVSPVCC